MKSIKELIPTLSERVPPLMRSASSGMKLSKNQLMTVLSFLECEMEDEELGSSARFELWREISRIKALIERAQKVADDQAFAFELQIRKARCQSAHGGGL